ncbi:hypothetical protein HYW43_02700 [Candidatus Daviesbacteria bacterium]|nr:hypothetical protein [Candidatus Daviesbacteria bacterium]
MNVAEIVNGYRFAFLSGISIANNQYPEDKEGFHLTRVHTHALARNLSPADTRDRMLQELRNFRLQAPIDLSDPLYWQTVPWKGKARISSLHLFGLSVCFADLNDMEVPDFLVPPKSMVFEFCEKLLISNAPLLLHDQFAQALGITGPYPTATSILLMIATRAIARDQETKILGTDFLDSGKLDELQFKVAGFDEQWVESEPPDPTGNTYYFWTNVATSMLLRANRRTHLIEDVPSLVLFPSGAKIMELARRYSAKQPNPVSHKLPSRYGLQIGRSLADTYLLAPKHIMPEPQPG